jgi:hypothetical protein
MKIKEIQLVTDIENIYADGIDVIVILDDDFSYVIEIVILQHLLSLMAIVHVSFDLLVNLGKIMLLLKS